MPLNVGNYIPVDKGSHHERLQSAATPLWKHQISQASCETLRLSADWSIERTSWTMHIPLTAKHNILWNRNTRGDSTGISYLRRQSVFLSQDTQTPHLGAAGAVWVQRAFRPRPQRLSPLPTTDTSPTRALVNQTIVMTYHTVYDISTLALSSL